MSDSSQPAKRYGLRLALPGAPNSPQVIPGWPGLYRPDIPTPVGGPDDALSLEEARERISEIEARVEEDKTAWDAFEANQKEKGLRPHGATPFVSPAPPVELVEISDVDEAERTKAADRAASINALREARANSDLAPTEVEHINNETTAIKEQ